MIVDKEGDVCLFVCVCVCVCVHVCDCVCVGDNGFPGATGGQ